MKNNRQIAIGNVVDRAIVYCTNRGVHKRSITDIKNVLIH